MPKLSREQVEEVVKSSVISVHGDESLIISDDTNITEIFDSYDFFELELFVEAELEENYDILVDMSYLGIEEDQITFKRLVDCVLEKIG